MRTQEIGVTATDSRTRGEHAGVPVTDDTVVGAAASTVEPFDTGQCWWAGDGWYPHL